jgi:hypothetical protein
VIIYLPTSKKIEWGGGGGGAKEKKEIIKLLDSTLTFFWLILPGLKQVESREIFQSHKRVYRQKVLKALSH